MRWEIDPCEDQGVCKDDQLQVNVKGEKGGVELMAQATLEEVFWRVVKTTLVTS